MKENQTTKLSSPCELVSPTSSPLYTPRKTPWTPLLECKNDNVALTKLYLLTKKEFENNYTFNSTLSLSNCFSVFEDDEDCVDENCVDGVNDVLDVPVLNSLPNNQFLNIDAAFQITFHLR